MPGHLQQTVASIIKILPSRAIWGEDSRPGWNTGLAAGWITAVRLR